MCGIVLVLAFLLLLFGCPTLYWLAEQQLQKLEKKKKKERKMQGKQCWLIKKMVGERPREIFFFN